MKLIKIKGSFLTLPVTGCIIIITILFLWASLSAHYVPNTYSPRLRRALLKMMMQQNYQFVPANSPALTYTGRWMSTTNQLRKDVSFPGASVGFEVANTTSVFMTLRNELSGASNPRELTKAEEQQIYIYSVREKKPPSTPVSLLVQINQDHRLYFDQNSHGTLEIASSLDRERSHHVRITYLASKRSEEGTLEFEGIWLSKGGELISHEFNLSIPIPGSAPTASAGPHFEVVTPLALKDPNTLSASWPSVLASYFNTIHTIFPTSVYPLTPSNPATNVLLSDLYFRSGPPSTPYFQLPHRFTPPLPSALILDIGLLDFNTLLADKPSTHAIKQYLPTFIRRYTTFISTIRASAYPYHSPHLTNRYDTIAVDASFTYNSAPSTLPIFLMTPFTPSRQVQRLLSHAVSEVVNSAQRGGDKSTFWLDTSGWLGTEDFEYERLANAYSESRGADAKAQHSQSFTLTPQAHRKIASYLSQHLCPYLSHPFSPPHDAIPSSAHSLFSADSPSSEDDNSPPLSDATSLSTNARCPFNKHDNYQGQLYLPSEAGMGKALEERKLELIRRFLGLEEPKGDVLV